MHKKVVGAIVAVGLLLVGVPVIWAMAWWPDESSDFECSSSHDAVINELQFNGGGNPCGKNEFLELKILNNTCFREQTIVPRCSECR